VLEIVHRYVEQMDKYYGNVCELDIIFNFQKAYFILDELLLAGEMQESSKKNVLRCIGQQDSLEDMEVRGHNSLSTPTQLLGATWLVIWLMAFTPTCQISSLTALFTSRLRMMHLQGSCELKRLM